MWRDKESGGNKIVRLEGGGERVEITQRGRERESIEKKRVQLEI